MNAEVFAKGLKKCRLLTRLIGQNVENLHDYGCPKIQDLVKTDSSWICCSYTFQHKTRLHSAERKAQVYGEWATQHLEILYVFIFLCLPLIYFVQLDMIFSIAFFLRN